MLVLQPVENQDLPGKEIAASRRTGVDCSAAFNNVYCNAADARNSGAAEVRANTLAKDAKRRVVLS